MRFLPCCHSHPAAASRSTHAVDWPLRARAFMRRLFTTGRRLGAVVALHWEGGDPLLSVSVAVQLRQGLAAFGAAARGSKFVPALDAVAVPVVALVNIASRQRETDGTFQSIGHRQTVARA